MQTVDGGMGGGQLVRLAVALAAVSDTPIEIENVREERPDPGLKPQHVASIEAVADLTDSTVAGVTTGSTTVQFIPGNDIGGETSIDIGTAGSIPLLFDAVLPLAVGADAPIEIQATGGTDVKWAPPLDYLRSVKQPMLEDAGVHIEISAVTRGFYPEGGGSATLRLQPAPPPSLHVTQRGTLDSVRVISIESADLADADVADRQIAGVGDELEASVAVPIQTESSTVESVSTGSVVTIVASYDHTDAGFSALGEPGRPAEAVGEAAATRFLRFHTRSGAVDSHLADQLLPFLALGKGTVTAPTLTDHIRSATSLLETFGYDLHRTDEGDVIRLKATDKSN